MAVFEVTGVGVKVKLEDPVSKDSLRDRITVHVGTREKAVGGLFLYTHGMMGRAVHHWRP